MSIFFGKVLSTPNIPNITRITSWAITYTLCLFKFLLFTPPEFIFVFTEEITFLADDIKQRILLTVYTIPTIATATAEIHKIGNQQDESAAFYAD